MSDCHPYPQDITADPFFIFGGLFSRRVVVNYLKDITPAKPSLFSALINLSDHCSQEAALQRGIQDTFNRHQISCIENHDSPRFDRLIEGRFGIEIKLNKNRFDPQFWQGSKGDKNAVEQTRRYLDQTKDYKWALLTNGKVIRLMHKDHALNFFDLWICDSDRSGETAQAAFFEKLLRDEDFLEEVHSNSEKERARFNKSFSTNVQEFWQKYQELGNRILNLSLVEAVLLVAFYRYLEDCGILPVLEKKYQQFRLNETVSAGSIIGLLRDLRRQRFLSGGSNPELYSLISDASLRRVENVLKNERLFLDFKKLFWDAQGAVDLSDLRVAFFGDAYQLFANKTDINGVDGQYFTGSELARETAIYFVEEERRGIAPEEIIYDPFVGSGQLLRALVPFFHILIQGEERDPSIIGGMRKLALRLAGTDIDPNACWLARLSLTIATSERGKPLLDFGNQIIEADVFSTCFGFTESKWQEQLGLKGRIRAIITNPPWRLLQQTTNELYTIQTGHQAPLRKNLENWARYQEWLQKGGRELASTKASELKRLSIQHRETFARCGQRKVNLAISGLDFVDRIPGVQNKNVMKFGVVFGGGSPQSRVYCSPMGRGQVDVTNILHRIKVLPIFGSEAEAVAQAIWFSKCKVTDRWKNGEFNETGAQQRGAKQTTLESGTPKQEVRALASLLNSPIADLAIRSLGSKRNINAKDLNKLGLPKLDATMINTLASADNFIDATAAVLLLVFQLSKEDSKKLLKTCGWISHKEQKQILKRMSGNPLREAQALAQTSVQKRGQVKRARQVMAGRSRRRR
ncbi:unnamed protein product [Sphagnum tenellum]